MGLLKSLFILICITLPLGVLIRISMTPQAFVYPVDVAVLLFVLVGVYQVLIHKSPKKWVSLFSLFLLAALVSLIVNIYWLSLHEFIVASLYLVRFSMYLLIIPIISSQFKTKDVKWLVSCITLSLFSTVVLGLVQYFLYPDLRNLMYLGWDEHHYRIFSSFLDPNFASIIFIICLWLLIAILRNQKNKTVQQYVVGIMIVITFIALLLTYSRTGYLAFGLSAFIFLILEKKIKIFALIVLLFMTGIVFLPKDLQSEGVNLFRTASIYSRIESFQAAQSIIEKNPIFGVGFNTYRYAQEWHGDLEQDIAHSHAGAGVSNSYLFVIATTGIVGFIAFMYAIVQMAKELQSIARVDRIIGNSMIAIFVSILVGSLVENVFFYSSTLITLFILVGIGRVVMGGKKP